MFLKSLKIESEHEVIRDISFRMGANLIVDETISSSQKESGNNVGKTTVIRLIDFCLGGDGNNIYSDTEFRNSSNHEVESFLKNNEVIIEIILKEDLKDDSSEEIRIRRNFLARNDKIQEINEDSYSNNKLFSKKLKEMIFKNSKEKPSFRQIIAKNIRVEKEKLANAVKVLPVANSNEYESLYYFWFGINLESADRKQELTANLKLEKKLNKKLGKEMNLSQIEQSLIVIERDILDLVSQKETLNINENFEQDFSNLNEMKYKIGTLSTYLSNIEYRRTLIEESKESLQKQLSEIDLGSVEKIYEEAVALIPEVQKSFEETLNFHNAMVKNKIDYIERELPDLIKEINDVRNELDDVIKNEIALGEKLKKSKSLGDLEEIITKLNQFHESKGHLLEKKELLEKSTNNIEGITQELEKINKGIRLFDDDINEKIADFNLYFSNIAEKLYGEKFVLSLGENGEVHKLNISSAISANLGTGKKKGQIAAFDLAYIKFADANNINCLHFILHDQIENIHDNQIASLLEDVVTDTNCQYIVPVLRDKLPDNIDIDEYTILILSEKEKLFKI